MVCNPKLTPLTTEQHGFWEGCLSVPGLRGYVERPKQIRIDYQSETGEELRIEVEGFLATVFQHELDHMEGTNYTKKASKLKLERALKRKQKMFLITKLSIEW